jgi:hypothetical protein
MLGKAGAALGDFKPTGGLDGDAPKKMPKAAPKAP